MHFLRSAPVALAQVAVATLALTGCYSPDLIDCSIVCDGSGGCPDGLRCGTDNRCHRGSLTACEDGFVPPKPDAPSLCDQAYAGEPDNSCPGETIGPVPEGKTIVRADHRMYPQGDVDVFRVTTRLNPVHKCGPGGTASYAFRMIVEPPSGLDLRIRRFDAGDRTCGGPSTAIQKLQLDCVPFTLPCNTASVESPTFYFAVEQVGGAAVCTPYTLAVQVCAAGSTCPDNCITL